MRVILASASPRRMELLAAMGLRFEVVPSGIREELPCGRYDVAVAARRIAQLKAAEVSKNAPDAVVIAADTLVCLGRAVLGKPAHEADARRMLRALSGKTHRVVTGVAVCAGRVSVRGSECTLVTFRTLMEEEILEYVRSGEPKDKAGAYAIQGHAGMFVARLIGCYYNVVGLPVFRLARMLRTVGVEIKPAYGTGPLSEAGGAELRSFDRRMQV